MTFRTVGWVAVLALGLALGRSPAQAQECSGADCAATAKPSKPLDIMKFMREQAASTRPGEPATPKKQVRAASPHLSHHTAAASPKPAPLAAEASTSFASQPQQSVQVVASDEFNTLDAAAPPAPTAPAETVGAAVSADPGVSLVGAEEFNDVDRKAAETAALAEKQVQQSRMSWAQWIWSALTNTFTALAMAMHHLIA